MTESVCFLFLWYKRRGGLLTRLALWLWNCIRAPGPLWFCSAILGFRLLSLESSWWAKWQLAECRKQKGKGRKHLPVEVAALRGPGTVTGTE